MMTLLEAGRAGLPLTGRGITDMHGHIGRHDFAIPDLTLRGMVRVMDRIGVERIVCSHMRCMTADCGWGNREVLKAMRAFPRRILGYGSVWPGDSGAAEAEVRFCLQNGFSGFKMHNHNGFAYDHDAYRPVYEAAEAHRMPLLFHTWGDEETFGPIRKIAATYPRTSVLLAHSGSSNEAGYAQMVKDLPNVYLDLCLSVSPLGLVKRLADAAGAERLVWGSDCYFIAMTQQLGKVLGARLPDTDKELILSANARRILARVRGQRRG